MFALLLLPSIVTLPPRAATPPGPYAVTDLGVFDPKVQSAHANDVNEAGQVVGYAGNRAFVWQHGALTALPTLGGTAGMAEAINDIGQIAGMSTLTTPPTGGRAVLWDNGGITNLTPALGQGETSSASGINDTGEIVGTMNSTPFIWRNGVITPWEISAAAVPALPATSTTPARPSDRRTPDRCHTPSCGRTT